jgi:hypothetical protein
VHNAPLILQQQNTFKIKLMATEHQVICINKSDRTNPHEKIISIGGINADNTRWKLSQEDAVKSIEAGTRAFYVLRGSIKTKVVVARSAQGHKYLKTEADSTTDNNLLSLPECP